MTEIKPQSMAKINDRYWLDTLAEWWWQEAWRAPRPSALKGIRWDWSDLIIKLKALKQ